MKTHSEGWHTRDLSGPIVRAGCSSFCTVALGTARQPADEPAAIQKSVGTAAALRRGRVMSLMAFATIAILTGCTSFPARCPEATSATRSDRLSGPSNTYLNMADVVEYIQREWKSGNLSALRAVADPTFWQWPHVPSGRRPMQRAEAGGLSGEAVISELIDNSTLATQMDSQVRGSAAVISFVVATTDDEQTRLWLLMQRYPGPWRIVGVTDVESYAVAHVAGSVSARTIMADQGRLGILKESAVLSPSSQAAAYSGRFSNALVKKDFRELSALVEGVTAEAISSLRDIAETTSSTASLLVRHDPDSGRATALLTLLHKKDGADAAQRIWLYLTVSAGGTRLCTVGLDPIQGWVYTVSSSGGARAAQFRSASGEPISGDPRLGGREKFGSRGGLRLPKSRFVLNPSYDPPEWKK